MAALNSVFGFAVALVIMAASVTSVESLLRYRSTRNQNNSSAPAIIRGRPFRGRFFNRTRIFRTRSTTTTTVPTSKTPSKLFVVTEPSTTLPPATTTTTTAATTQSTATRSSQHLLLDNEDQETLVPTCRYEALSSESGTNVSCVEMGAQIFHRWTCEFGKASTDFCMTVHSCFFALDMRQSLLLLDQEGCSKDRYIMDQVKYSGRLAGSTTTTVLKFGDYPWQLRCHLKFAPIDGDNCRRSSDSCLYKAAGRRKKRHVVRSSDDREENIALDSAVSSYVPEMVVYGRPLNVVYERSECNDILNRKKSKKRLT